MWSLQWVVYYHVRTAYSLAEKLTFALSKGVVLLSAQVRLLSLHLGSLHLVAPQLHINFVDPRSHVWLILDFSQFCLQSHDDPSGVDDPFLMVGLFRLFQPKGLVNVFNLQKNHIDSSVITEHETLVI